MAIRHNVGHLNFGGNGVSYIHNQTTPSNEWIIKHNLNTFPPITFIREDGVEFMGRVTYINENTIKMNSTKLITGTALI